MTENSKELVHKLAKLEGLMRRGYGRAGRPGAHNPHRGQGRVLAILKLQPQMSQKELGYLLDMRKQSLGELLAKLEGHGLIVREPSGEDRRVMNIKLTEAGKQAAEQLEQENEEEDTLFAALGDEEQKQFGEYLDRLIAALIEKVGDTPRPGDFPDGFDPRFVEAIRGGQHGEDHGHHGPHGPGCGRGRGHHHHDGPHHEEMHGGPGRCGHARGCGADGFAPGHTPEGEADGE